MSKKNVVIIGAGPAGLAAGYEIIKKHKKEYNITILEETKDIGGISRTANYKGNRMDMGGHRFFTKDDRVNAFWKEIMPLQSKPSYDDLMLGTVKDFAKVGPDPEKEDNVMLLRNRVSRIYYNKKFFDYPISLKLQTLKNMGLGKTITGGFSYIKATLIKKEESNLENFFINRFGKTLYGMFFESYTEKLWGRHPRDIDASWGAQRVKGVSIKEVIKNAFKKIFNSKGEVETSLIEEFHYPKFGPGHFYETVAKKIEELGGTILKEHKVVKINYDNNIVKSIECIINGKSKEIKADYILSSMPLKDLINSLDGNKKDKNIERIAKGLPYRDFITAGLLLKNLNLKNETNYKTVNNIIPDNWVYVHIPEVKMIRFQIFNNWSPYMVKEIDKHIWIGIEYVCQEGDELWSKSDKEFAEFATEEFIKLNLIKEEDIVDTHVERVKKAYPAYFDTYEEIDKVIDYLNKFDNLFCIGRNGQHRYNNMDHSILTGFVAVELLTKDIKDKTKLWNVNTEKTYHEKK